MVDPRGKVRLLTTLEALPPNCAVCGCHADGQKEFVDFGFHLEFYGAVYFCLDCLTPVAEACDFVPKQELIEVGENYNDAVDIVQELRKERDKLRDMLDDLLAYRPSEHSDSSDVDSEKSKYTSEPVPESKRESTGNKPGTPKQAAKPGPKNVSKSTEPKSSTLFDI